VRQIAEVVIEISDGEGDLAFHVPFFERHFG
jgi:hypothetical protein